MMKTTMIFILVVYKLLQSHNEGTKIATTTKTRTHMSNSYLGVGTGCLDEEERLKDLWMKARRESAVLETIWFHSTV